MIVIANCQLRGSYGTVVPGDHINVSPDVAEDLRKRGLVTLPQPVVEVAYETKVIVPEEPKPAAARRARR